MQIGTNFLEAFEKPGHWLKVALHNHSTYSDGRKTPEEAIALYKAKGYDAFAFTDHWACPPPDEIAALNSPGFAVIPGVELDGVDHDLNERHHVVALGFHPGDILHEAEPIRDSLQGLVDWINGKGGLSLIAHPHWSGQTCRSLLPVERAWGMEILNTASESERYGGTALTYWDSVLRYGNPLWGAAVDDVHHYAPGFDLALGWVMVKAETNTAESIIAALREGHFYSSDGPIINDMRIVGDELIVRCSPVQRIVVDQLGNPPHFRDRRLEGESLTGARFSLADDWRYFRVSCHDEREHKAAWGQPIVWEK